MTTFHYFRTHKPKRIKLALRVRCPNCGAQPNQKCHGQWIWGDRVHAERRALWLITSKSDERTFKTVMETKE